MGGGEHAPSRAFLGALAEELRMRLRRSRWTNVSGEDAGTAREGACAPHPTPEKWQKRCGNRRFVVTVVTVVMVALRGEAGMCETRGTWREVFP